MVVNEKSTQTTLSILCQLNLRKKSGFAYARLDCWDFSVPTSCITPRGIPDIDLISYEPLDVCPPFVVWYYNTPFFRNTDHTRCTGCWAQPGVPMQRTELIWYALVFDINLRVERTLMIIIWKWIDADSKLLGKIWNSKLQLLCVCACVRGKR